MNIVQYIKTTLLRTWLNYLRPSHAANIRRLQKRNESLDELVFRDIRVDDLDAIVRLHVKAWADTYPFVKKPPTYATREWQWKEQFSATGDKWFCIVIENTYGELVGFAKGRLFNGPVPGFEG